MCANSMTEGSALSPGRVAIRLPMRSLCEAMPSSLSCFGQQAPHRSFMAAEARGRHQRGEPRLQPLLRAFRRSRHGQCPRAARARRMNSLARSGSTAFQVLPSTFSAVPTMQPSATRSTSRHGRVLDAGVGEHGRVGQHLLHRLQLRQRGRFAGDDAGDQDGVGDRGEHRAARPVGQAALIERPGELGGDVVEHREVVAAEPVAVAHGGAGIGIPRPHVGGIGAGQDLADEAGAGGGRERHRAHRIPQHVDAERHGDLALHLADGVGHGRSRGGVDLELVGPVVLVAEHDGIDPGGLQRAQVVADAFDQPVQAGVGIMERRARQRTKVNHCDHWFLAGEDPGKARCHVGLTAVALGLVVLVGKVNPASPQGDPPRGADMVPCNDRPM